jgi:hypothetical protein
MDDVCALLLPRGAEGLPGLERLRNLLKDENCFAAASSGEILPDLVALMDIPEYRGPIFNGPRSAWRHLRAQHPFVTVLLSPSP